MPVAEQNQSETKKKVPCSLPETGIQENVICTNFLMKVGKMTKQKEKMTTKTTAVVSEQWSGTRFVRYVSMTGLFLRQAINTMNNYSTHKTINCSV